MALTKQTINVLLSLDQLAHVLLSPVLFYRIANPDETISSRIGKIKLAAGGKVPWRYPLAKVLDWGLEWLDPGHSIDAIEDDED